MKNMRCIIAAAAAAACCGMLASCGSTAPEPADAPVSSAPASPDAESSTAEAEAQPSAAEQSAAESEAPEQPADPAPAGFNENWKGQIKTRKVLYYREGALVDDKFCETYEYDENGRVSRIHLAHKNEYVQYDYDDHGNVVRYEDILDGAVAVSKSYAYEYYDNGQMSKKIDYSTSFGGSEENEPGISSTISYDTQGRETERYIYFNSDPDKIHQHYVYSYDDSKPHECVLDIEANEYDLDGEVDKTRTSQGYAYTLPDPMGNYRFDEVDMYTSYDNTTEAMFYQYYETNYHQPLNCTYDDHGSVIDDGNGTTYAYEYSDNGALLKMTCYDSDGEISYEYEYDGNGHITRNKTRHSSYIPESLPLNEKYDEVKYEYTFY